MLKLTLAAAAAALASAAVPGDKIATLPGFGTPLSDLYSGMLASGAGKHAHYVYSSSLNKPSTDDVVLWFNGGWPPRAAC